MMNANVFHFIFSLSDPLQTEDDLKDMFNLLYNEADKKRKLHLLQSRTLDNRSPLVLAVSHPSCTESIIKKLIEKNENINQFLFTFDLAAKRHITKLNLLQPLLDYFDLYAKDQRHKLMQIACRHNNVEMLDWLIEKDSSSKFIS
jgi:hypothetical protein